MELTLWIFGGVLFIFSLILWNLGTKFDVQKEHCFELENRIDELSVYTIELEKRLIILERSKQSEIKANYNMDFTHINTDI